jgi:hypothetical protein
MKKRKQEERKDERKWKERQNKICTRKNNERQAEKYV